MEIKTKKLTDLKPAPYNPRTISDKAMAGLRASIDRFGLVEPIVINRDGRVIGGHQRLKVLKEQGVKKTKVVVVDLTKREEKALNVTLNNPHVTGEFIPDLQNILEGFKLDIPDAFEALNLDELYRPSPKDGNTDPDDIPASAPATVKTGEIWQLGKHRVMCGDSTKAEDVEALMDGQKAGICFTSPPYAEQREYGGDINLSTKHLATFIVASVKFIGHYIVNLGYARKDGEVHCYWDDYIGEAKKNGLKLLSWNVWDKGECGSVGNQTAMFGIRHEWLFVFGTKPRALNKTVPNKSAGEKANHTGNRQKNGRIKKGWDGVVSAHRQLDTVITQVAQKARNLDFDHPAIFPVDLPRAYIEAMTSETEVVYDPFLGSGTTLIACEQLDRICYGMEIDPKYVDVVIKRYEDFTGAKARKLN